LVARKPEFQIRDPLALLGTNAVPDLVNILRERTEPQWIFQLRQKVWNDLPRAYQARFPDLHPVPGAQVRRTALFGLRFLGPEAEPALPDILRIALTETNLRTRAAALVAALNVAPQAPGTFEAWRAEWETTNHFSRHDLAIYLKMPRVPIPAAVPYLLAEMTNQHSQAVQPVVEALGFFGDAARPALPEMIKLFEAGGIPGDLLLAFKRLGPLASGAVPALTARLRKQGPQKEKVFDTNTGTMIEIDEGPGLLAGTLRALGAIGLEAKAALPAIAPFLTNSDLIIRFLAAAAQVRAGGSIQEAMPILVAGLEQEWQRHIKAILLVETPEGLPGAGTYGPEAAAILCGELGGAAGQALAALERRLQDEHPFVRIAAAQAIWRISHDPKESLPTLVAVLDSVGAPDSRGGPGADYELVRAIEAIEEMGPAGRSAIPNIEAVRTFSMAARHAANEALRKLK
jgi:HEAT repeat protein